MASFGMGHGSAVQFWQSERNWLFSLMFLCVFGTSTILWRGVYLSFAQLTLPQILKKVFEPVMEWPEPVLEMPKVEIAKPVALPGHGSLDRLAALSSIHMIFDPQASLYRTWTKFTASELDNWKPTPVGAQLGGERGAMAVSLLRTNIRSIFSHSKKRNKKLKRSVETVEGIQRPTASFQVDSFKFKSGADLLLGRAYARLSGEETSMEFDLLDSGAMNLRTQSRVAPNVTLGFQQSFTSGSAGESAANLQFRW